MIYVPAHIHRDLGDTLYAAIVAESLTAGLVLCLDAGDSASYSSGQPWLDRSGGGYDFNRGATSGAEASDPTFNSAGLESYWSLDGGDYFRYDTTNETWMQNFHKDNAALTILAIAYNGASGYNLAGTNGGSPGNVGFNLASGSAAGSTFFRVADGSGGYALSAVSDAGPSDNAWHVHGVSINEAAGAGGGFLYLDGAYHQVGGGDTFDAAYVTPSAANATYTMEIGAYGNATTTPAGSRIAAVAAWSSALTKANLDAIFARVRKRFSL